MDFLLNPFKGLRTLSSMGYRQGWEGCQLAFCWHLYQMVRSTVLATRRKDRFNLPQFRVYQNVCFGSHGMGAVSL
jgi:hypothetical protein